MSSPALARTKAWCRQNLHGVQNCLIPSFTADQSQLDEAGIRLDVEQSIRHGFIATLCVTEAGLTLDEAQRFVAIVADQARGRILVSTTAMFESFEQSIALLRAAESSGCDFAFIDVPRSWQPADENALYDGLRRLCDATSLGVFLHPVPHDNLRRLHRSGYAPRLLARLAEIENVVAAEVTDFGLLTQCLDVIGDAIVLQCPLERLWPMLATRCGVQLLGPGAYELYQSPTQPSLVQYVRWLREGEREQAMDVYWRLSPVRMAFEMKMMQMMPSGAHPLPLWKYYQWLAGGNGGYSPARLPIMEVSEMDRMMARQARAFAGLPQPAPDDAGFFAGRVNSPPQPDLPTGLPLGGPSRA